MRHLTCFVLLCLSTPACAAGAGWPPSVDLGVGTSLALTGNFAYDINRFDADARLQDAKGWRRVEFGFVAKRKDYFDAGAQYEFESRSWLDMYARLHSKGMLGRDVGSLRAGWIKTPVGLDGLTASRAPAFLETSLPSQAIYAGRRAGVEYTLSRPRYQFAVAHYGGNDPEGNEQGIMWGFRGVWTPVANDGDVWHVGASRSVEDPATDRVRLRARPEAGLTDVRLVDTGTITGVDTVERSGLELIRVAGPFAMQAEYLRTKVDRQGAAPDVEVHGGSLWVGWVVTGERRPYKGTLGNVEPAGDAGAVEVLARYSRLDLDGTVQGGTQANATLGVNYYWTEHLKLQANYVHMQAPRADVDTGPSGVLVRAQVHF